MQEVKVELVPNVPGNVAKMLTNYIQQGYKIDAYSTDSSGPSIVITILVERNDRNVGFTSSLPTGRRS